MGRPRSTCRDTPAAADRDAEILARIKAVGEEFGASGHRRICAGLRHHGLVADTNRVRRPMREHALQPRRRRRHGATTDSDHESRRLRTRLPG
jgi:hypothetical protein